MGILKDAIKSSLGSSQINNGLGGPRLPFGKQNQTSTSNQQANYDTSFRPSWPADNSYNTWSYQNDTYPPPMSSDKSPYRDNRTENYSEYPPRYEDTRSTPNCPSSSFLPVVLPQISYGDGQPFLRAYSDELRRYNIQEQQFIQIIDAINIANTPNPENIIFQKAANIAGWFVPGAAGIGLMGGQVVAGVGAAFGHYSMVKRVLSKANLETFLPVGLEIGIGKTSNVDQAIGVNNNYSSKNTAQLSPDQYLQYYSNRIARLSTTYPPVQNVGRKDPIAFVGRAMQSRGNQKKMSKAQEDMQEGKAEKMNDLSNDSKWLIIRPATPNALAHWQKKLQESNAEIEQAQNESRSR